MYKLFLLQEIKQSEIVFIAYHGPCHKLFP